MCSQIGRKQTLPAESCTDQKWQDRIYITAKGQNVFCMVAEQQVLSIKNKAKQKQSKKQSQHGKATAKDNAET